MRQTRLFRAAAAAAALILLLTGCGSSPAQPTKPAESSSAVPDASGKYVLSEDGEAILPMAVTPDGKRPAQADASDNDRVFYEIFVGSFSDSNGDGIGDLKGIINRLDYLNDGDPGSGLSLGVEGIWLTPVFDSPSYHKYDVTDYYMIDPDFGTEEDMRALIAACRARGIKVILDLPINHTGDESVWFKRFRHAHINGNTSDPYYNFYHWYTGDRPDNNVYTRVPGTTDVYVEANFSEHMPELNYDDPFVREQVLSVARYWLEMGVDGFRYDAAKYIYLGDNAKSAAFWEWYNGELRKMRPEVYLVAEVWDGDGVTDVYYPSMNCFNFTVSQQAGYIAQAVQSGSAARYMSYLESYQKKVSSLRDGGTVVPFITNHDMDRAAGFLTVGTGRMMAAANLLILSPGSPFLYYGEELGIRGSRGSANTDANRRLAMVWGDGDTVKDPEGTTYDPNKQIEDGAAVQKGDGDSLYSFYKNLIGLRKANPEIASGRLKAVTFEGTGAAGFLAEKNGALCLVLHNPSDEPVTVDLASQGVDFPYLSGFSSAFGEAVVLDSGKLTLPAMTSAVLREKAPQP